MKQQENQRITINDCGITVSCVSAPSQKEKLKFAVWLYVSTVEEDCTAWTICLYRKTRFSINTSTTLIKNSLREHSYVLKDDNQMRFDSQRDAAANLPLPLEQLQVQMEQILVPYIMRTLQFSIVESEFTIQILTHDYTSLKVSSRCTSGCRTVCRVHITATKKPGQIATVE